VLRKRKSLPSTKEERAASRRRRDRLPQRHRVDESALVRGGFRIKKDDAEPDTWRLYDLAQDPGETNDLSQELPELKAAFNEYAEGL
jgi:arylsulfatase A-like enzyme